MSKDEMKAVILHWFETLNQGELSVLDQLADELFTGDFTWHDPRMAGFPAGPAGIKMFIRQLLADNTNVRVTVEDMISSEDRTAYRFTVSMNSAASREPVTLKLLAIDRFVGGQIAEEWQISAPGAW